MLSLLHSVGAAGLSYAAGSATSALLSEQRSVAKYQTLRTPSVHMKSAATLPLFAYLVASFTKIGCVEAERTDLLLFAKKNQKQMTV